MQFGVQASIPFLCLNSLPRLFSSFLSLLFPKIWITKLPFVNYFITLLKSISGNDYFLFCKL